MGEGATQVLSCVQEERQGFRRLVRIWVDQGFSGEDFIRGIMDRFSPYLEVVQRPVGAKGFILLPRRCPALAHLRMVALVPSSQHGL